MANPQERPTLREQIEAELERREWIVEAAMWEIMLRPRHEGNEEYLSVHDPDDARARYAAARRLLKRHHTFPQPETTPTWYCEGCDENLLVPYCLEVRELAASIGIMRKGV